MMNQIMQRLTELERRLANILIICSVSEVDYDQDKVKVIDGEFESTWVKWIVCRASNDVDYWAPEIGEQVLLLSPGGSPELGVVLPAIYQNKYAGTDNRETIRRTIYADSANFSYDREAHALTIILPDGATTELISTGGIKVTGDTTIEGQLHVTKNIKGDKEITDKTRSMSADREIYNNHDHPHGDPTTGKVNQQQ